MTAVSSLLSQILPLPPSCIAFCPTQPSLFVVGTYFLHKDENESVDGKSIPWQKRTGSLILFLLESEGQEGETGLKIHELCTLKTDFAILDVQWSPHRSKGQDAIAVAASNSLVELYELKLSPDGKTADLVPSAWLGPFEEEAETEEPSDLLALSTAWHPANSKLMVVTLSNGQVQYCTTEGDFAEIDHFMSWSAPDQLKHDLEAWTAAFSPTTTGVFSGGDDCVLRYMKPHWGSDGMDGVEASWQDKRLHGAGVTAILPLSDELVVTGSYDDHVRLIAAPSMGRRQVLADHNLEGGVWRLKVIEADELPDLGDDADSRTYTCTILASCMHAGTRVLRLRKGADGAWRFEVMARFTEHESMNYGSDVQPTSSRADTTTPRTRTVVSTSFYDQRLCVWKVDVEAAEPAPVEGVGS